MVGGLIDKLTGQTDSFLQVVEADGGLSWTYAIPGGSAVQVAAGPSGELVYVGSLGDAGAEDVWLVRMAP